MKTIQITETEQLFLKYMYERFNKLPLDEVGGIFLTIDLNRTGNLHYTYLSASCLQAVKSVCEKLYVTHK